MRDLTRVIEFMCKEVIPLKEVALIQALKDVIQKVIYCSPENQARLWVLTSNTLYEHIGLPEGEPWKIRIENIMADKEKIPQERLAYNTFKE